MKNNAKIISVFGSSAPKPGSADYEAARTAGRLLAQAGFAVQTGAYSGVMAAASQGANEAGGHVIGVTSAQIEQFRPAPPNRWVIEEIKYQTLRERQVHLVSKCDGAVVMPGGTGTLAEMAMMWSLVQVGELSPRPIVAVGGLWQRTLAAFIDEAYVHPAHQELLTVVRTVDEAVKKIIAFFAARR
ncbi:MAG: LOG family protein [Anaerolineae bacterium]|nr:LOG family protein [Anaerolineae bacterium]